MAKYRREFLIPYFENVSALHLALHKLQNQLTVLKQRKSALKNVPHCVVAPEKPCYEAANGVFFLGLGAYLLMFSLIMFVFRLYALTLICAVISIMAITIGTIRYVQVTRQNNRIKEKYKHRLAHYLETKKEHDLNRDALSSIETEIQECETQIQRAIDALGNVYQTNVIPQHHQNIYAAIFLYIWFRSGRPNNLDMALKILQDELIKEKLDQFITKKQETILKQHLLDAQKNGSPKLQKDHAEHLAQKVQQLDASEEERNTYLTMIQSSIVTTTFFATASYIGQI